METEFTEDAKAHTAVPCDRCQTVIQPGETRRYVVSRSDASKGKHCCIKCWEHYNRSLATTTRTFYWHFDWLRGDMEWHTNSGSSVNRRLEHIETVRRSVNDSQRKGSKLILLIWAILGLVQFRALSLIAIIILVQRQLNPVTPMGPASVSGYSAYRERLSCLSLLVSM